MEEEAIKIKHLCTELDAVREQLLLNNPSPPPRVSKMSKEEIFEQLADLRMKVATLRNLKQGIVDMFESKDEEKPEDEEVV
jgi:hypothetical protein